MKIGLVIVLVAAFLGGQAMIYDEQRDTAKSIVAVRLQGAEEFSALDKRTALIEGEQRHIRQDVSAIRIRVDSELADQVTREEVRNMIDSGTADLAQYPWLRDREMVINRLERAERELEDLRREREREKESGG